MKSDKILIPASVISILIIAVLIISFLFNCGDYTRRDKAASEPAREVVPKPEPSSDEIEKAVLKAMLFGSVNEQLRIAGNGADPYNPNRWEIYREGDFYYTVLDRNAIWMVSNELFNGSPIILVVNEASRHLTPHLPIPDTYDPATEITYAGLGLYLAYKSSLK